MQAHVGDASKHLASSSESKRLSKDVCSDLQGDKVMCEKTIVNENVFVIEKRKSCSCYKF